MNGSNANGFYVDYITLQGGIFNGGMVIKKSPYLTSTTAWFVLGRKHNIIRYKRQGLVTFLRDWTMSNKLEYVYGGEFREVFDSLTYDAVVGSTGV